MTVLDAHRGAAAPRMPEFLSPAREVKALGVQVAHGGTVAGCLSDLAAPAARLRQARLGLARLGIAGASEFSPDPAAEPAHG